MDKIRNNTRLQVILASVITLTMFLGAYWVVNRNSSDEYLSKDPLSGELSDIVSTEPRETASGIIKANGTMGLLEDITVETLVSGIAFTDNIDRRMNAISEVENALVPGSPLISESVRKHAKIHTRNSVSPTVYIVDNVKVGNPKNERSLDVRSESGMSKYKAIDIEVSFDSIRSVFTKPGDTSYDGTYTQVDNKESYTTIVTLIQSGELWFVYDIKDSENMLTERFATWRGISNSNIDHSNDKDVGYIKVPGVESTVEETWEPDSGEEEDNE